MSSSCLQRSTRRASSSQHGRTRFAASLTRGVGRTQCRRYTCVQIKAMLSPGGGDKKKFITREEEPEEYWASKGEKDGANPFKDPIAIVGIIAIFFPFIFLLIAIATGAIDTSVYR